MLNAQFSRTGNLYLSSALKNEKILAFRKYLSLRDPIFVMALLINRLSASGRVLLLLCPLSYSHGGLRGKVLLVRPTEICFPGSSCSGLGKS